MKRCASGDIDQTNQAAVWATRIREPNPARVWGYFNNDFNGHAIENARELTRQLVSPLARR
jgi:uncharacterized protein YecE (DUF72 family)